MTDNKKTDYLREDPVIYNQDWCVLSIVNPRDRVEEKTLFYLNNFLVNDVNKTIEATTQHVITKAHLELKNKLKDTLDRLKSSVNETDKALYEILNTTFQGVLLKEQDYLDECMRKYKLDQEELSDKYKVYLCENRNVLDRNFDEVFGDLTSVRGIKNRGNYGSYREAERRAKDMREFEPAHNVFVAPVGKWCPVDFESDEIQNQDYMNDQLNELMGKYHENIQNRNKFFNERKKEMYEDAVNNKKLSTKQRLQEKLKQQKNDKIRKEIEAARVVTAAAQAAQKE
jgi:hypothetical protein